VVSIPDLQVAGYVIDWYQSLVPILSLNGSCKPRLKKKFHREIKLQSARSR
jgi:hypothetical protein